MSEFGKCIVNKYLRLQEYAHLQPFTLWQAVGSISFWVQDNVCFFYTQHCLCLSPSMCQRPNPPLDLSASIHVLIFQILLAYFHLPFIELPCVCVYSENGNIYILWIQYFQLTFCRKSQHIQFHVDFFIHLLIFTLLCYCRKTPIFPKVLLCLLWVCRIKQSFKVGLMFCSWGCVHVLKKPIFL